MMTNNELWKLADHARQLAYAPYSTYTVGAALLCKDGSVYTGCNIENAAYSPTNCAERTAFFKAISEGHREFTAMAISGGSAGQPSTKHTFPCGVCRQVMLEFCSRDDFTIITRASSVGEKVTTLAELTPHPWPDAPGQ